MVKMKYNKDREQLIETLSKYIPKIIEDSNSINEIASHLSDKHNIDYGDLMFYFNDPTRLEDAELSFLALVSEQLYLKLEDSEELALDKWFNPNEIKEIRQYYFVDESLSDKIELPITLENVVDLGDRIYLVPMELSMIARMRKYELLNYNSEIQREAKLKVIGNKVREQPKVYDKNVAEIKDRILKGIQKKTTLAYNCATETSDHESEQELIYNKKDNTLTITEGTRIDILDGMHRTLGIYAAYLENRDLQGKMPVLISNMSTKQAKEFQFELSKATPINKARAKELAQERYADELVDRLKSDGELKGRISQTNTINKKFNQLTTSSILSDAFDKHWEPKKRKEIDPIISEFNKYLDVLFDEYKESINDKNNLLFSKTFFIGHVILAQKMHEKEIPYEELNEILDDIDFSRNNPIWKELNIIREDGRNSTNEKRMIKGIETFFKKLI